MDPCGQGGQGGRWGSLVYDEGEGGFPTSTDPGIGNKGTCLLNRHTDIQD